MTVHKPHAANVPGDFYVEENCCTMCQVPVIEAPELFGEIRDPEEPMHCFVKQQPRTPEELIKMIEAIRCAELDCIHYRGSDRLIQLQLVNADSGHVCDHLLPEFHERVAELEAKRRKERDERKGAKRRWWMFWR